MSNVRLTEGSNIKVSDNNSTLRTKLGNAVQRVVSKNPCSRHGSRRMMNEASQEILDLQFVNGRAHQELQKGFLHQCKTNACTARNTLKAMGLSSGSLSLISIEVLRPVECLEKRERGLMPSVGQAQNVQVILPKCDERATPRAREATEEAECVTFDVRKLVKVLIFSCESCDIGRTRSLVFAIDSNSAKKQQTICAKLFLD